MYEKFSSLLPYRDTILLLFIIIADILFIIYIKIEY